MSQTDRKAPAPAAVAQAPRLVWGRFLALLLVWLVLTGAALKDLPVGIVAAALGAWMSARLLPGAIREPRILASIGFLAVFLRQSVLAGIDVARRVFDPVMPLDPGLVDFAPRLGGLERSLFAEIASMAPGTLPVGETEDRSLVIHCLDKEADIQGQLRADENRLAAALGREASRG